MKRRRRRVVVRPIQSTPTLYDEDAMAVIRELQTKTSVSPEKKAHYEKMSKKFATQFKRRSDL